MKKSLCALLLFILLPLGTAQSAEFKLTGRTTWQLGQLMVNGIPFVRRCFLNRCSLNGTN
ncbi:hypothetical protein CJI17_03935 [Aeromonas salmonicida]|nr:hypothetical protein CJI17_03935 [Aeromonas salmonicida]